VKADKMKENEFRNTIQKARRKKREGRRNMSYRYTLMKGRTDKINRISRCGTPVSGQQIDPSKCSGCREGENCLKITARFG